VIDLSTVRLTEGRAWLHAFPVGRYVHPIHGELTFTAQRLQRIADGVNSGVRGISLALDYDHRGDVSKGGRAAGWVDGAEVRSDGLWLSVSFTAQAAAEIRAGEWRYFSPEFAPTWTDPRTGVVHTDVLLGGALTNRPFLRDLAPIAASEGAVHTPRSASLVGAGFGGAGRGQPGTVTTPPAPVGTGTRGAASVPTRLAESVAALRFFEAMGHALLSSPDAFDQAMEQAAREDPAGYAAYRQTTYVDGGRRR
jgi:hypothetical protein